MDIDKRESLIFYERYSMDELYGIHKHIKKLSSRVSDWKKKYKKYMNENKYPSIKYLQQLLNMTEKFPYTIKEIHALKRYIKVVDIWLKEAETLLLRDKRNVNKENLKPRSLDQIRILISKADIYAFDSMEIKSLRSLYDSVINFQVNVSEFLRSPQEKLSLNEVKELVRKGRDLDVDIPEMEKLELLHENLVWRRESDLVIVNGEIEADYKTVNHLIEMAKECKIPSDNKIFLDLCHEKEIADDWKRRAEKLIAQDEIDLKDLESILDEINDIPNIEGLMEDLHNMQVKAEDYIKMAKMYLDDDENDNIKNQVTISEEKVDDKKEESINKEIEKKDVNNEKSEIKTEESKNNEKMQLPYDDEENDNELCRCFDNDHEEDDVTIYEDSMDIGKDDYQKIKRNKEIIASRQKETSKYDLKFILNNSPSDIDSKNDADKVLNSEINNLVYNTIHDAVDEIRKEPLVDLANTKTLYSGSNSSSENIIYKLPSKTIDIPLWKERNGLDEGYNLKELKKSSNRKKDKKNKKKKAILTIEDFHDFIETLKTNKVKIDIQKELNDKYNNIQNLFEKGQNFFDHEEGNTFSETLENVLENIKNCVQTLNLNHEDFSSEDSNENKEVISSNRELSNNKKFKGSGNKSKSNSKDNKKKNNNSLKNAYCFCRTSGEGFMVACDVCNEWYHGEW